MDSDDEITLSSSTMDALKAFYAERDESARRFAELSAAAAAAADASAKADADADAVAAAAKKAAEPLATVDKPLSMSLFAEDWNASQFWYSDETAALLARHLLAGAGPEMLIGVVSAPSVFVALKNALAHYEDDAKKPRLLLLEYDARFGVFPEFVHYDFNTPTRLPAGLRGTVDRMIIDPPFLSEDCQTKAALTARWLSSAAADRLIVCTGERMAPLVVGKLYKAQGLQPTSYEPQHAGLSNEFYCYANFETADWMFKPLIEDST